MHLPVSLSIFLSDSNFVTIVNFMLIEAGVKMKQLPLPDYTELSEALNDTALKMHASQVHGIITGLLCGNPNNKAAWEEMVTGNQESETTHKALELLYEGTAKHLSDFEMDFQLVLPDDDDDLQMRAEGLTLWCQGFLTGLKSAGVQVVGRESGELTEAIDDLVEIAKMNYEEVVASEEDEEAYVELVEYVRMAVIMINQEIREEQKAKKAAQSSQLH